MFQMRWDLTPGTTDNQEPTLLLIVFSNMLKHKQIYRAQDGASGAATSNTLIFVARIGFQNTNYIVIR